MKTKKQLEVEKVFGVEISDHDLTFSENRDLEELKHHRLYWLAQKFQQLINDDIKNNKPFERYQVAGLRTAINLIFEADKAEMDL